MNCTKRLLNWLYGKGCPRCNSRSANWHPESEACADCGYGVVFSNPVSGSGARAIDQSTVEAFLSGDMTEDDFAQAAMAGGMRAATILELIDQRRADFHDRGEEPPL